MLAHVAVEGQLVAGAVQVVGGILDLVVGVAIQVVGEEPHALHEGEQRHGIGQQLYLQGCEEVTCRLQVASGESLENLRVEAHARAGSNINAARTSAKRYLCLMILEYCLICKKSVTKIRFRNEFGNNSCQLYPS